MRTWSRTALAALLLATGSTAAGAAIPRAETPSRERKATHAALAGLYSVAVTEGSLVAATITNYGFIGNSFLNRTSSFEYPAGSGYEHLVHGGLWVGAQTIDGAGAFVGVSTACLDHNPGGASTGATEFTPIGTSIERRSSLPNSPFYDPRAISESDYLSECDDLTPKGSTGNPEQHRPLGLSVRQECYSWSFGDYQHVLFFHYVIRSVAQPLSNVWVGLYTELASGDKNSYSVWPPSSSASPYGGWFSKKWLEYDAPAQLTREHYCAAQPVPGGCQLQRVPYWAGIELLTPPDPGTGQHVTLAAWPWSPGDASRDQDTERYALMSAGSIQDLAQPELQPQPGDPAELIALGPFASLASGDSISVDFALIGGAEVADIQAHAQAARDAYHANYHVDPSTAALLSLADSHAEPGRAQLRWYRARPATRASVYRREERGAWTSYGVAIADNDGYIVFEDRAVVAGASYGYRLGMLEAGVERIYGETSIKIPIAPAFTLGAPRPNPSMSGELNVEFSLTSGGVATLEVLDLAGRSVVSEQVGALGPGTHKIRFGQRAPIPPGAYFIRLTHAGGALKTKAVVLR